MNGKQADSRRLGSSAEATMILVRRAATATRLPAAGWGFSADGDLNYASNSTDAGVGFGVLIVGLGLQAVGAINTASRGGGTLLLVPLAVTALAWMTARWWRRRRELAVIAVRINELVVDGRWSRDQWPNIVYSYARALGQVGRGRQDAEDAWGHLDRIYGEGAWLPEKATEGMRRAYETYVAITYRNELGDLWLPWYVHRDDPSRAIQDIESERANARQLRIRDVVDDPVFRPALEEEYDHDGQTWSHRGRIDEYRRQWDGLTSLSPGASPLGAPRTGPSCGTAVIAPVLSTPSTRRIGALTSNSRTRRMEIQIPSRACETQP